MTTTWELDTLIQKGPEYHELAVKHRALLECRLEAGLIEGMGADLLKLTGAQSAKVTSRTEQKASTQTQSQTRTQAAGQVTRLRDLVRTHHSDRAVQKSFGIGQAMDASSLVSVKAGVEMLLKGCAADPAKAREAGILPADIERLQLLLAALSTTDVTQESKKVSARTVIVERNAAHRRLERAFKKLSAISEIVFEDQPDLLASFRAAMPQTRHKSAKKKPAAAPVAKSE